MVTLSFILETLDILMTVTGITVFLVSLVFVYNKRIFSYWEERNIKHETSGFLKRIFWTRLLNKQHTVHITDDLYNAFPKEPYVGFYDRLTPQILVRDLDLLQKILETDFDYFQNRKDSKFLTNKTLFKHFLTEATGRHWKNIHTCVLPTFSNQTVKTMSELMLKCTQPLLKVISEKAREKCSFESQDLFTKMTVDCIALTVFGVESSCLSGDTDFLLQVKELTDISTWQMIINFLSPILPSGFGIQLFSTKGVKYFSKIVEENMRGRKSTEKREMHYLSHLLGIKESSTVEEANDLNTKADDGCKINPDEGKSILT